MEITKLQRFQVIIQVNNTPINTAIKEQTAGSNLWQALYVYPSLCMYEAQLQYIHQPLSSMYLHKNVAFLQYCRATFSARRDAYFIHLDEHTLHSVCFTGHIWYAYIQIHHHIHNKTRHFPNNNYINILKGAPNISGNMNTVRWRRRSTGTNHSGIT